MRAKTTDDDDDDDDEKELMMLQNEFTAFAIELAEAANKETLKYWRKTSLGVETKNDASPVTVADKTRKRRWDNGEKSISVARQIFGEEHGIELGLEKKSDDTHEYLWVFDPIDGTKSFITGKPLWGTFDRVVA